MALEDLELNVGGTQIKGVWIGILVAFSSTIGGGIWTASEFFSRLEALEGSVIDASSETGVTQARFEDLRESQSERLQGYQVAISNMEQQLADNNISELQGKLAELGTNLEAIMKAQQDLLDLRDRIAAVEKSNAEAVLTVNNRVQSLDKTERVLKRVDTEIENLWQALDSLPFSR
jgi:predicted  nucleic acid-binding Zn-ribbon protein